LQSVTAAAPSAENLTRRVLAAYREIDDPRLLAVVEGVIKHMHACITELRPSDEEYEFLWTLLEKMAAYTTPERNEFLLLFDVLGVSQLVDIVRHPTAPGAVGYALVGPFYRDGAPWRERGASIASDDTAGIRVAITGRVHDLATGRPIAGAVLDTWQAATNGLYENQDPAQPPFNLRGRFRSSDDGTFELVALMPTAYPVPTDGPVGALLEIAKRPPYRPAHIHFIVSAPGYETLVTQVFVRGDNQIDDDVVFTADADMVGAFVMEGDRRRLHYDLPLTAGTPRVPKAPLPA